MKYYFGPWVWNTDAPQPHLWTAPQGCTGCLDLRNHEDQARRTHGDRPYGFFWGPNSLDLGNDYTLLGTGHLSEIRPSPRARSALQQARISGEGETLLDTVWRGLTEDADPRGQDKVGLLVPGADRSICLALARHGNIKNEKVDLLRVSTGLYCNNLRTFLQNNLSDDESDHGRRCLDAERQKYGLLGDDWKMLVRPSRRNSHPGPLPHQTTATETFTAADQDFITSGIDNTWVTYNDAATGDTFYIRSNRAHAQPSNDAGGRCEVALSSADHYVQATLVAWFGSGNYQAGVCTRFAAAAHTCYQFRHVPAAGVGKEIDALKSIAGAQTQTTTGDPWTAGFPEVFKLDSTGTTHTAYIDDAQQFQFTDSTAALQTPVRCGIYGFTDAGLVPNATQIDDWSADDGIVPGPSDFFQGEISALVAGSAANAAALRAYLTERYGVTTQ